MSLYVCANRVLSTITKIIIGSTTGKGCQLFIMYSGLVSWWLFYSMISLLYFFIYEICIFIRRKLPTSITKVSNRVYVFHYLLVSSSHNINARLPSSLIFTLHLRQEQFEAEREEQYAMKYKDWQKAGWLHSCALSHTTLCNTSFKHIYTLRRKYV